MYMQVLCFLFKIWINKSWTERWKVSQYCISSPDPNWKEIFLELRTWCRFHHFYFISNLLKHTAYHPESSEFENLVSFHDCFDENVVLLKMCFCAHHHILAVSICRPLSLPWMPLLTKLPQSNPRDLWPFLLETCDHCGEKRRSFRQKDKDNDEIIWKTTPETYDLLYIFLTIVNNNHNNLVPHTLNIDTGQNFQSLQCFLRNGSH